MACLNPPHPIVIERVQSSYAIMERYYSTFVFEDYLEMFVEELRAVKQHDEQYFLSFFQDFSNAERSDFPLFFRVPFSILTPPSSSDCSIVLFLRFLTSAELRTNADTYIHFLPPPFADVEHFCGSEVETMGKESEEIHIVALATFLQVNLRVAHLDQSDTTGKVNFHPYTYSPDTQDPFFTILYRPGHYDLLYH